MRAKRLPLTVIVIAMLLRCHRVAAGSLLSGGLRLTGLGHVGLLGLHAGLLLAVVLFDGDAGAGWHDEREECGE